ncbi:hypothetical protein BJV77DRAFT_1039990, partial [Russula vinacea]
IRHRHPSRRGVIIAFLFRSLFEIWCYSPIPCSAVWIPRPCRTPSCQVSTACHKRLSAWFRHWQGKMMPRNGQFDLSILFVCSGFSLRAPRSKLCYRNTESVFLNSTRVVAREQQQVQALARTRNNIVLPTQSISNLFDQKSVCFSSPGLSVLSASCQLPVLADRRPP